MISIYLHLIFNIFRKQKYYIKMSTMQVKKTLLRFSGQGKETINYRRSKLMLF